MNRIWLAMALVISGLQTFDGVPAVAKPAHRGSVRAAHRVSAQVDKLFRVDMLNSNRDYVEHIIGPAKYTTPASADNALEVRTYSVDGCTVEIGYKDRTVSYLGLRGISPSCTFPLGRFIPHTPPTHVDDLYGLTFGTFEDEVGPGIAPNFYDVECLGSCGNSADASVLLYHAAPHVDDFIDVLVQEDYPYVDKRSDKAFGSLEDILSKRENSDYVAYGRIKCDLKYQSIEKKLFKSVIVKNVYVGLDLGALAPNCRNPQ
jgi:hypothetical protein